MPPPNFVTANDLVALLADDDDNDVLLIRRAIERLSLFRQLIVVSSGEQAIACLEASARADNDRTAKPSIVILDQFMPRWSGLDVLGWLRNCSSLKHLPAIILSLGLSPAHTERARLLRAACCPKTPHLEGLPAAVQDALGAVGQRGEPSTWHPALESAAGLKVLKVQPFAQAGSPERMG
ncbi:MAG: hypothetical protein AB9869_09015 [Verrucomicrobiia bacterium]